MKNSNDTIGNRTRDLPTCSALPQPTAIPRALIIKVTILKLCFDCTKIWENDFLKIRMQRNAVIKILEER